MLNLSLTLLNVKLVPQRRAGVSDATTLSNAWQLVCANSLLLLILSELSFVFCMQFLMDVLYGSINLHQNRVDSLPFSEIFQSHCQLQVCVYHKFCFLEIYCKDTFCFTNIFSWTWFFSQCPRSLQTLWRYVVNLHNHISFIIFYVLTFMLWFHFVEEVWLIANIAWMINECITWICGSNYCQNQIIFFSALLIIVFLPAAVSIGAIAFLFFWHIIHNVSWVLLLLVVSFTPCNFAVVFVLFFFHFLSFCPRCCMHIGSVPYSSSFFFIIFHKQ